MIDYIVDWVIPFLIVLSVLVFVHELGHYLVARYCGVRVEVFSIGFGREIFGITDRHRTRWKFSLIPLGGYVKMFGEADAEDGGDAPMSARDREESFQYKRVGQRAWIVAAGPLANFLFAIVLMIGVFAGVGVPAPLAGIGTVMEDSAAARAGLEAGDRILRIDGTDVEWFEDVRQIVSRHPEQPLAIEVQRDGNEMRLTAVPERLEDSVSTEYPDGMGLLGIRPDPAQVGYERVGLIGAVGEAMERYYAITAQIVSAIGQIVTGSRSTEELGGPLRIAQLSGQMAQDGFVSLVFFMAALSINLGLINLLPVPMLDGGHLAFYLIEAVRGKPVDKRIQEYGFRFGLVFVLLLILLATWNDLVNLRVLEFLRGITG